MSMTESKSVATDRLRREGRWDEASIYKDETISKLRKDGMQRQQAQDAGWSEMLKKYPPLPEREGPPCATNQGVELLDIDPVSYGGQSDSAGDVAWVYSNLTSKSAAPRQAPSSGAWGLLQWARRHPDKFFPMWLKTISSRRERQVEPWMAQEQRQIDELEKMVAAFSPANQSRKDVS